MISSLTNPKIKFARRLQTDRRFRTREQSYVVEGTRWLNELVRNKHPLQWLLVTSSWVQVEGNSELLKAIQVPVYTATDKVMSYASQTESPAGMLAVVSMTTLALPDKVTLLLILDRVNNPGNLGAMLRTAEAAGADGVILGPGCVDAYNPKVLRASMGTHLRLPILIRNWQEIRRLTENASLWAASTEGSISYRRVNWREPSALIIGSEAVGLGPDALTLATGHISIPMQGATESLNAAVATGIILFEAVRQRSNAESEAA